jgi:aminoglycoside phosphotransferase
MNASALLAFDPAVPDRDSLLDEQQIGSRLATLGHGTRETRWRVGKIKYHVGRDLRVVYRAADDGQHRLVAVRTARRSATARVNAFPIDRRLDCLPAVMTPRRTFGSLLGGAWVSSRLAGYAPEKSAVVACRDVAGETVAYAKLFADSSEARRAFDVTNRIERTARSACVVLRVPRPLALADQPLLVLEAARGRRLTELAGAELERAVTFMGAALAELHATRAPLDALGRDRTADTALISAARILGRARPDLANEAEALAASLAASRPRFCRPPVALHGDVQLKNVLLDGERIWLIDFDQIHTGPAAADLGSFLAVLHTDAVVGARTAGEAVDLADALLRGYAGVRSLPALTDLRWHTAAALLSERALRAVTRVRRDILAHLPALLADAGRSWRRVLA